MPIFRVEKNRNYTTMSNYHLQDKNLSLKAKGLLSMCLSLTECWDYSINGLTAISKEGRDAVLSAVRELEQAGYVVRGRERDERGCLRSAEYKIFEMPQAAEALQPKTSFSPDAPLKTPIRQDMPMTAYPAVEKPAMEKPVQVNPTQGKSMEENPAQLSTNQSNTKEINNVKSNGLSEAHGESKGTKDTKHRYGTYHNVLLSDAEKAQLKAEFPTDYQERVDRLSEYMASTGKRYKNHLVTIRCWARNDRKKAAGTVGYSHEAYRFAEGESL